MIVSRYTLSGRVPWRTLTVCIGCPPLCVRIPVFLHQSKLCLTLVNLMLFVRWLSFFDAPPRPCSLVCHVLLPNMIPVGWWFLPRCAPGRGLWLSATVSLWRFWPRFYMYVMSGRSYQLGGRSHCRGKILCVFYKNVYPLFEGYVFWLCRTGFVALRRANDDTRVSSDIVVSPPRNSFAIPVCLRNVTHLYQFPDSLVAVAVLMPLKASRLPLMLFVRWLSFFDAPPRPCSLVCHVLFLIMSPVGWLFPPRWAPGRWLWLFVTVSLWRFWTHFFVCGMSGRPYQLDEGSHCCGKVLCIFCYNIYPLFEGCVCICPPL